MVVTNSPPRPSSEQSFRANFSGEFSLSDMSHSNWSTSEMFPTWMFSWSTEKHGQVSCLPPGHETLWSGSVERHLDDDPLVRLVLQDAVCWVWLDLLSDGGGDGGNEGQRVQVQVITQNLCEHLRRHELLCLKKGGRGKEKSPVNCMYGYVNRRLLSDSDDGTLPFMFQVKASLSFWPSISMSKRIGTRTSVWVAFSWITAGSWSSKLSQDKTTETLEQHKGTSAIFSSAGPPTGVEVYPFFLLHHSHFLLNH